MRCRQNTSAGEHHAGAGTAHPSQGAAHSSTQEPPGTGGDAGVSHGHPVSATGAFMHVYTLKVTKKQKTLLFLAMMPRINLPLCQQHVHVIHSVFNQTYWYWP